MKRLHCLANVIGINVPLPRTNWLEQNILITKLVLDMDLVERAFFQCMILNKPEDREKLATICKHYFYSMEDYRDSRTQEKRKDNIQSIVHLIEKEQANKAYLEAYHLQNQLAQEIEVLQKEIDQFQITPITEANIDQLTLQLEQKKAIYDKTTKTLQELITIRRKLGND